MRKIPSFFLPVFLLTALFGFFGKAEAATFVNETFTDTVGVSLTSHTGETGATWSRHPLYSGGTASIDSTGKLRYSTVGARPDTVFYASGVPASADYQVDWDILIKTVPVSYSIVAAIARASTTQGTWYAVWYDSNGLWSLYKYVNNIDGGVLIGSYSGAIVQGATYHGRLILNGTSLVLLVDGTQRISVTDSGVTSAGRVGVLLYGTTANGAGIVMDNLVAGDAASSYTFTGPTSGTVNQASFAFTVTPNGVYTGTITPASTGSGTFLPTSLTFSGSSAAQTLTYTPTSTVGSPHTISVTSSPGITNPSSIAYSVIVGTTSPVFSSDTFTDSNGTALASHVGEIGATWTKNPGFSGAIVIDDANRIRSNTTSPGSLYYSSGVPASADYDVQADVTLVSGASDYAGVAGRMSTSEATAYFFEYSNARSRWELYAFVNNSGTLIGSLSESFGSAGTTHTIKLSMRGTTISGYSDGVLKVTGTNSSITAPGRVGVIADGALSNSTGQHLDNFVAQYPDVAASSYTFTGPTSGIVNQTSSAFTVTPNGLYTGTITPASTGSGTFSPTSLTFSSTSAAQTFTYRPTSTSSPQHTISISSSPAIANPASIGYAVGDVYTGIAVSDASLYWSRDNVYVNGSSYALMLTPGSYLKANFSGTSIGVNIDVSASIAASVSAINYPIVRYQIDSGSWTSRQLDATTSEIRVAGLSSGAHSLRFEYEAGHSPASSGTDKWNTPVNAVKVTGLTIDDGASTSSPSLLPAYLRIDGDSITEGLRDINTSDTPAGGTAPLSYPYLLAGYMNSEFAQIGYGGQGWASAGTGNVPSYPNAAGYYYNGVSRLSGGVLAQPPDYWMINQGTNDGGDVTSAAQTRLGQARTEAGPSTHIFLSVPFNGSHRSQLTAAYNAYVAANPSDNKVHLLDLGSISFDTTDGTHPSAAGHATLASALYSSISSAIDAAAPIISSISVSPTQTTATITWTTNEAASSTVRYGSNTGYGTASSSQALVTSHSITVTGLTASTLYHYQIAGADATGNISTSTDRTFTTSAVLDTTAPSISAIASSATDTGATVTWTTNEAASSQIEYGTASSYTSSTTLNSSLTTGHSEAISGLTANTVYHFRVLSADASSNLATSSDQTFTTAQTPVVSSGGGSSSGGSFWGSSGGGNSVSVINPVPTVTVPIPTYAFTRDLTLDSTGADVTALQRLLISKGYLAPQYATGFFGSLTKQALIRYQLESGIVPASGYFGPITKAVIGVPTTTAPVPLPSAASASTFTRDLQLGSVGEDVRALQAYLNAHGFILADSGPGSLGNETATFGKATLFQVVQFQKAKGITPSSGYFGPKTRQAANGR